MRFLFTTLLPIALTVGCNSKKHEKVYTFLEISRNNRIDSTKWHLANDFIIQTDSFYYISGLEVRKNKKDSFNIKLPKIKTYHEEYGLQLSDSILLDFEGDYFTVYKYEEGHEIDDGLLFIYLEPSIGVLIIKSASWGTYSRLVNTGKTSTDKKIFFLNERIISNNEFFNP